MNPQFFLGLLFLMLLLPKTNSARLFPKASGKENSISTTAARSQNFLMVDGWNASHERPFFAVLTFRHNLNYCGAAIIHRFWIITAAHCVFAAKSKFLPAFGLNSNVWRMEGMCLIDSLFHSDPFGFSSEQNLKNYSCKSFDTSTSTKN